MRPEHLPLAVLRSTRLLHASGISQAISASACDAVFAAFDVARGGGAIVTYDPNVRLKLWPLARASAIVHGVDGDVHVVPAEPGRRERAVRRRVAGCGGRCDSSRRRARRRAEAGRRRLPRLRRHAARTRRRARGASVDATGAGDCFDGAFAARLMAGDDPFAAARYANVAAALATTGYGAVAPLPRAADVEPLLSARRNDVTAATFHPDLFAGKVALVVGGTTGIGAGIADAFAGLGAVVTVTGATPAECAAARSSQHFRCRDAVALDVRDEAALIALGRRPAAARRARELRGHHSPRRRARRRGVRAGARDQSDRHDARVHAGARKAEGGRRRDRQHRVGAVVLRRRAGARLCGEQGRGRAAHEVARDRLRGGRDSRQRASRPAGSRRR